MKANELLKSDRIFLLKSPEQMNQLTAICWKKNQK